MGHLLHLLSQQPVDRERQPAGGRDAQAALPVERFQDGIIRARYRACAVLAAVTVTGLWVTVHFRGERPVLADPPAANRPLGEAKGLHAGRVVWVRDPDVTDWEGGTGDGNWWFEHIDAEIARGMVPQAVCAYAGTEDAREAWDAIFRHFNRTHGRGDAGYRPGEKIVYRWDNIGKWACQNDKWNHRPKFFGNSKFVYRPRLTAEAIRRDALASNDIVAATAADRGGKLAGASADAHLDYQLRLPYPACGGTVRAKFVGRAAEDAFSIALSLVISSSSSFLSISRLR